MSVFTNIASSIGAAAGSVSGDLQGVGEAFTAASHKQGAEKWVVEHDQLRQRFSIKLTASGVATPAAHAATTASTDGRLAAGLRSLSLTAAAAPEASLTYKLLGSATCQQAQQGCTQAELVDIFVPEAFRERGCASALVAAMLAYAAERSICDVRVPSADVRRFLDKTSAWKGTAFEPMLSSRKAAAAVAAAVPAQATSAATT